MEVTLSLEPTLSLCLCQHQPLSLALYGGGCMSSVDFSGTGLKLLTGPISVAPATGKLYKHGSMVFRPIWGA